VTDKYDSYDSAKEKDHDREVGEHESKLEDLFADDKEPILRGISKIYHLVYPHDKARTTFASPVWADVEVDSDGYCELRDWKYFEQRPKRSGGYNLSDAEDAAKWEAMREVWSWLSEWELVELKPIGPEDSEYFATEKLLEMEVKSA
jgi:hypothetical protein